MVRDLKEIIATVQSCSQDVSRYSGQADQLFTTVLAVYKRLSVVDVAIGDRLVPYGDIISDLIPR